MLIASLALVAAAHAPLADTLPSDLNVYEAVIADVRARSGSSASQPFVTLSEALYVARGGTPAAQTWHSREMIERLRDEGWIQASCRTSTAVTYCASQRLSNSVNVRLGPVIELPGSARVSLREPYFPRQAETGPDTATAVANVAVDVVVSRPCPDCRNADVTLYRYFLRKTPTGCYQVVTRWLSGIA